MKDECVILKTIHQTGAET